MSAFHSTLWKILLSCSTGFLASAGWTEEHERTNEGLLSAFADRVSDVVSDGYDELVLRDRFEARWQAVRATRDALAQRTDGGQQGFLLGLSDSAIAAVLEGVEGTVLERKGDGLLQGTTVRITDLTLQSGMGALEVEFAMTAEKGPVALDLDGRGSILVSSIAYLIDDEGEAVAELMLRIEPSRISPQAGIGSLSLPARGLWQTVFPELATALLDPALFEVPVEVPAQFSYEMGMDSNESVVVDEEQDSAIDYRITMRETEIVVFADYEPPIYIDGAIWLAGRPVASFPNGTKFDQPAADRPVSELRAEIDDMQTEIGGFLESSGIPDLSGVAGGVGFVIGHGVVDHAVARLADLSDAERTITIAMTGTRGDLYRRDWRDRLLGRGGIRAYAVCPDCAGATIEIGRPVFDIRGPELKLWVPIFVNADLGLRLSIDPLVGGGASTSVGLEGSLSGRRVGVTATTRRVSTANSGALAIIDWRGSCSRVDTRLTTDGRLSWNVGWMSVPRAGAKVVFSAGGFAARPVVVLDETPTLVALPRPRPLAEEGPGSDWELQPAWSAFTAFTQPLTLDIRDKAIVGVARLVVLPHDRPGSEEGIDRLMEDLERRVEVRSETISATTEKMLEFLRDTSSCPEGPEFTALIGNVEIGPNNEIVKFLNNLPSDVWDGPGEDSEVCRLITRLGADCQEVILSPADSVPEFTMREDTIEMTFPPLPGAPDVTFPLPLPQELPIPPEVEFLKDLFD